MTRHAVLTDTHVLWISENARKLAGCQLPIHAQHVSELWAMGKDLGVTHFWVFPSSSIDGMGYSFLVEKDGWDIMVTMGDEKGAKRPERPRSASCTRDNYEVKIGYPFREPFGWTCNHPLDVLAGIDYLEHVLQITVQWSPQSMGKRLLHDMYRTTKRLQSYVADSTVDLSEMPFRKAAPDTMFLREWTPDMIGKWAHVYDKNAAHPTAAGMVTTGIGDPVHRVYMTQDGTPTMAEPEMKPGIYRVKFNSQGSPFDGVHLPKIIASEWVTKDVLNYAMKNGYKVQVQEGYEFQGYRLFEKWSPTLWNARQALKNRQQFPHETARENAYWTVKDIATRTISTLRENWWADMVGLSRVAKLANLAKWAKDGMYPQFIWYDDMCFLSDDPEPEAQIIARFDKPGGYKHKCSVYLTPEMVKDLQQIKKPNQALTYVKRIASEKGLVNA